MTTPGQFAANIMRAHRGRLEEKRQKLRCPGCGGKDVDIWKASEDMQQGQCRDQACKHVGNLTTFVVNDPIDNTNPQLDQRFQANGAPGKEAAAIVRAHRRISEDAPSYPADQQAPEMPAAMTTPKCKTCGAPPKAPQGYPNTLACLNGHLFQTDDRGTAPAGAAPMGEAGVPSAASIAKKKAEDADYVAGREHARRGLDPTPMLTNKSLAKSKHWWKGHDDEVARAAKEDVKHKPSRLAEMLTGTIIPRPGRPQPTPPDPRTQSMLMPIRTSSNLTTGGG